MRCFLLSLVIHIQVVTLLALQSGYRSISSQIIAYRSNKGTDGCSSLSSSRASPLQLFRQDSTADTLTIEEIEKFATFSKLKIKSSVTGPYLRLEAYPIDDETSLVGYLTAFIRPFPFKLFQLDTIQVKNRRQNIGYKRKNWTVDGPGASFILGTWALAWARQQGCQQTELLAVRDSDEMHDILVRLYGSFGFRVLREVGEDSVADRLVWGATGTLMAMDIPAFFTEWTPKTRAMLASMSTAQDSKQL